jgi:hypothetical protein
MVEKDLRKIKYEVKHRSYTDDSGEFSVQHNYGGIAGQLVINYEVDKKASKLLLTNLHDGYDSNGRGVILSGLNASMLMSDISIFAKSRGLVEPINKRIRDYIENMALERKLSKSTDAGPKKFAELAHSYDAVTLFNLASNNMVPSEVLAVLFRRAVEAFDTPNPQYYKNLNIIRKIVLNKNVTAEIVKAAEDMQNRSEFTSILSLRQ